MLKEINIPVPFRFNAFKHHRLYVLTFWATSRLDYIQDQLEQLCNNYIDVYTGALSVFEICEEIRLLLGNQGAFRGETLSAWLELEGGFRELRLTDDSIWIVREGNETERYVHIHPARSGPHVVRYKGSTLKTVFMLKLKGIEEPDLEAVNSLRQQVGLSPVRRLDANRGILKCFREFFG